MNPKRAGSVPQFPAMVSVRGKKVTYLVMYLLLFNNVESVYYVRFVNDCYSVCGGGILFYKWYTGNGIYYIVVLFIGVLCNV